MVRGNVTALIPFVRETLTAEPLPDNQ